MLAGFWLARMCLASPFDHLEKSITVLYRSLGIPLQTRNMLPLIKWSNPSTSVSPGTWFLAHNDSSPSSLKIRSLGSMIEMVVDIA